MRCFFLLAAFLTLVVTPQAAAPITVGGTVLTATGEPLAEAPVDLVALPGNYERNRQLLDGREADPVAVTRTGADGRFTLAAPAAGVFTVRLRPPGFVPMRFAPLTLVRPTELPPVHVLPDAGATVDVRGPGGEPLQGVAVLAASASGATWKGVTEDGWRVGARLGRSGPDGRLILPRAPGERLRLHAWTPRGSVTHRSEAGERAALVLPPPAAERVVEVRDVRGEPVAGVLVAVGDLVWPVGTTDESGRLVLLGEASGPLRLDLFTADGRRQSETRELSEADAVKIVLAEARRLSGRLVTADRRPLGGALLWPVHDPGAWRLSGADGGYRFVAPPGDRFAVQAEADGFLSEAVELRPGADAEQRGPTIVLQASSDAVVDVVDTAGAPLAGAQVEATALGRSRPSLRRDSAAARAVSGADGHAVLRGLDPAVSYALRAVHDDFGVGRVLLESPGWRAAGEPPRLVVAKARPGTGRVLDGEERPLAGVEVTVTAGVSPDSATVKTGADGYFVVAVLPAPKVDVSVRKPGFAPLVVRGVEPPAGKGVADLGTFVLAPGVAVTGVVRAGDEPVSGAEVWITEGQDRLPRGATDRLRREPPSASTDESGRFAVEDLERGRKVHVLVSAEGYLPVWIAGVEAPTREPLRLELEVASRLRGQVVDEDGAGVGGARVGVYTEPVTPGELGVAAPSAEVSKSTTTDGHGVFVFDELPAVKAFVEVSAAGFQPTPPRSVEIPAGGAAEDLRFVLKRGAVVEGRVTSGGGEPVAGARIRLGQWVASTDVDGVYRMEGVVPGRHHLFAGHLEYELRGKTVQVEPGVNVFNLVLEAGWPVSGRVTDDDGAPVGGAHVELIFDGSGPMRRYEATSDADGAIAFPRVVDGVYDVVAARDGYGAVEMTRGLAVGGGGVEGFEVVITPAAVVAGRLLGAEPEELATAEVEAEQGERLSRHGTVDYDGAYEIPDLSPGVWVLKARIGGGRREATARVLIEPGTREVRQDLELGQGVRLVGSVSLGGARLPETSVTLRGYDTAVERAVVTDHEGTFRIEDLEPGRYRLNLANRRESLLYNEDVELYADRELDLEIATAEVRGRVVSAAGSRPLPDAIVFVQRVVDDSSEPGSLISLPTDAGGGFAFGRLSAGRYRLSASLDGYVPAERALEVAAGEVVDDVELRLELAAGLEVALRLAGGGVPDMATVAVLDERGVPLLHETRSPDAEGMAQFPTVPAGRWSLLLGAPGAAVTRTTAEVPGPRLEVLLTAETRLAIRIPELMAENQFATVSLAAEDGRPFLGLDRTGSPQSHWTLAGGAGVVEGVPPGTWTLSATAADGRSWRQTIFASPGSQLEVILK